MKFVCGSPLSDAELEKIARTMVADHGEDAREVVNALIDDANIRSDFVEHATWLDVSLGVVQLLRPGSHWDR